MSDPHIDELKQVKICMYVYMNVCMYVRTYVQFAQIKLEQLTSLHDYVPCAKIITCVQVDTACTEHVIVRAQLSSELRWPAVQWDLA